MSQRDAASGGGALRPGARSASAVSDRDGLVAVASAERDLRLGAGALLEVDDRPQEVEALGDVRGQLDAFGIGRRNGPAVEREGDRARFPHGPFPAQRREAAHPARARQERERRLRLGLREVHELARPADLDAPCVACDGVEMMGCGRGPEVHGERPWPTRAAGDALAVQEDLHGRRAGGCREVDFPGPHNDPEEERQEGQHPG